MMKGMPSIPNFKGLVSSSTDALIDLAGAAVIRAIFGKQWGIVNEFGIPILLADNVLGVSYQNGSDIVNAPIENGSFVTYNKIESPATAVVQMSKGSGGALGRGAFLAQIDALKNSTLKFHVITPDIVHRNMTIQDYSYARTGQSGMQLITVSLQLVEIREVGVKYTFEEVTNPSDAEVMENGEVQAQDRSSDRSLLLRGYELITGQR
jgi:hypothetical protein